MTSRAKDELDLAWMALRRAGLSSDEIGRRYGVTGAKVRTTTNRIRADSIAAGEPDIGFWASDDIQARRLAK